MKNNWMKGTVLLTLTAFLTKILSMVYKVPYQNLVGDEGLYVFQQVYPLLGIYTTLNGLVLPTITSELLIEHQYSDDVKRFLKRRLWSFGLLSFALLFLGGNYIARAMDDRQLSTSIQIIGVAFLLLPPLSYLRAVHQTRPETIHRVGISITLEQLIRVGMIIGALFWFGHLNIYRISYLSYLLGMAGPVAGFLFLSMFKRQDQAASFLKLKNKPPYFRKAFYLFLSAGILIIFQLIDSFIVLRSLLSAGTPPIEAMQLKGIFDRGLPIIQSATFFVGAIVSSTIPQMIKYTEDKQRKNVFNHALFLVMAFSVPATVGLFLVMEDLNITLFLDNAGTQALQILALQVLFYPFIFLATSVLQQEDRYSELLLAILAGIFTKVMTTGPLTIQMGIMGTAISSVAALSAMTLIYLLQFKSQIYQKSFFNLLKISFASLSMWLGVDYLRHLIPQHLYLTEGREFHAAFLVIQVGAGLAIYGIIMLFFILLTRTGKRKKTKKKPGRPPVKKSQTQKAQPQKRQRPPQKK